MTPPEQIQLTDHGANRHAFAVDLQLAGDGSALAELYAEQTSSGWQPDGGGRSSLAGSPAKGEAVGAGELDLPAG